MADDDNPTHREEHDPRKEAARIGIEQARRALQQASTVLSPALTEDEETNE